MTYSLHMNQYQLEIYSNSAVLSAVSLLCLSLLPVTITLIVTCPVSNVLEFMTMITTNVEFTTDIDSNP